MAEKPSDVASRRLAELRRRRGYDQQQLADRLAELGHDISRPVLSKIESGGTRADNLSVNDWIALAYALDTDPLKLIAPYEEPDLEVAVAGETTTTCGDFRAWLCGRHIGLAGQYEMAYNDMWDQSQRDAKEDALRGIVRREMQTEIEALVDKRIAEHGIPGLKSQVIDWTTKYDEEET